MYFTNTSVLPPPGGRLETAAVRVTLLPGGGVVLPLFLLREMLLPQRWRRDLCTKRRTGGSVTSGFLHIQNVILLLISRTQNYFR